ncbi:uncharacterized protein Z518_01053 [Rhinocladiella mackenziei CBS 650.93]|uniref:Major facilitator superfamily (MFS) profile domain-containing protein n=1 Tax=Rhinocladiella mackenziei CBS 650.93 TaxID=1442369 RepID=A0A0D2G5B5_9EURO|nr:uncharacterized protein Z518_01053 [Rhinocladiella mackenziei CBS 650.93]KIX09972.1 hypothetical protein Z518_01053 [Rhinocladiella mackenziei CBS 650.93]
MAKNDRARRWYQIRWFSSEDTKEERKLIVKLDLLIVPYVCLAYWVKYIDQANINNAYVAGLKEHLGFNRNQLVQLQTMYILGAVLGQIPFMFLFTRVPMFWLISFLDVAWGIFTLLQYRTQAVHYIFGSWYRGDEIARRGGFFYVGLTLGTLTAALIQSAASEQLDDVNGLAGWRWMYIICAIITIPIGLIGYFLLPGTPDMPNRLLLKDHEVQLAKERLHRAGHATSGKFTPRTLKKVATNWRVWAFILLDIFFWDGSINTSTGGYLLWLKSLERYSAGRLNQLGSISPALGIFYVLFICFLSDLLWGPAWAITAAHIWNSIGLIILIIWFVPESAIWFAFMTTYSAVAMSSVLYGWVNSQLRYSPAERYFTLVLINTVAQSTTAWTPLLVFKTVEAPRFTKGYPFVLANAVCLIILSHLISWYNKRQEYGGSASISFERQLMSSRSLVERTEEGYCQSNASNDSPQPAQEVKALHP